MSQEGTKYIKSADASSSRTSEWITKLFQSGIRPKSNRRIGLEVERLALWPDLKPFLYRTSDHRIGAQDLLKILSDTFGWEKVLSPTEYVIGLKTGNGSVSLEPGSQVELSLDPSKELLSGLNDIEDFERKVKSITSPLGLRWLGIGVNPIHSVRDIDIIAAPRYGFMTDYYNKSGRLGTAMMRLTTSIQVNLDYSSEEEAIEMFRVAMLAAPISYLLFSNSPFYENTPSKYLSFRAEIWRNSDKARSGLMPELFQKKFGFKELAELFWRQPLMFAQDKNNQFIPAFGKTLLEASKDPSSPFPVNEHNQWNAIREYFGEARLKPGYVEVRSIDGLLPQYRAGAAAFWTGLLYGDDARKLALKSLGSLSAVELENLWIEISRNGFNTEFGKLDLPKISLELVKAAESELKRRGFGEEKLLNSVYQIIEAKRSPAAELLDSYLTKWNRDMSKVVEATTFF